jgi:hypothetical protein
MRAVLSLLRSLPLLVLRARLALLLHLFQLLLAAIVVLPLSRAFEATFGSSVAGAETQAGRFLEYAWQDWHLSGSELLAQAERTFSGVGAVGLFLSFTLLSAGTFAVLASRSRGSVRELLAGAGRFFARFTRLFVVFAAGCFALFWIDRWLTLGVNRVITQTLDRASPSRYVGALLHAKTLLAMALLAGWMAVIGLTKARLVREDSRSVARALLAALRSLARRPVSCVLLASFGPLALIGCVAAYAFARGALAAAPTTSIGDRPLPTWLLYVALTQLVGWLMQATSVVWTHAFVAFERPDPPEPALPVDLTPAPIEPVTALLPGSPAVRQALLALFAAGVVFGGAPPRARAQSAGAADVGLPAGPFTQSYRIVATLDPGAKTVGGSVNVSFTNPGAAPLSELVLQLLMNAFSGPETVFLRERRFRTGRDPLAGVAESSLGRCTVERVSAGERALTFQVDGTLLHVALAEPLAPGGSVTVTIAFTTKLASMDVAGRGGFSGDHFGGMQWFPKLAAFRDGAFDLEQFHADTEFFADFGDYDVTLITPERFVVGATGKLAEPAAPAPPALAPAGSAAPAAAAEPLVRRRFVAHAVHDFAWCADPHFVEAKDQFEGFGHTVAITYLCQPYALEKKELVLSTAKRCLQRYGEWFLPYPYDTLTIDGQPMGTGGGMEYPTLFTISQGFPNHLPWLANATEEPAGVTAHEFGHQFWYGILASDEVREAWLDEGLNTYVTTKVEQDLWHDRTTGGRALQSAEWNEVARPFLNRGVGLDLFDQPLGLAQLVGFETSPFTTNRRGRRSDPTLLGFSLPVGRTPGFGEVRWLGRRGDYFAVADRGALADVSFELEPGAYGPLTYSKTALAMATLESVFGWDAVRAALREYARRFCFGHPRGEDFLAVLREVIPQQSKTTGVAIEPFLQAMWKTSDVLDLAVAEARSRPVEPGAAATGGFRTEVLVENRGTMALPSTIRLRFADGHEEVEPWPADRRYVAIDRVTPVKLVSAEVDPQHQLLLDLDWTNNGRTVERNDDAIRRFDAAALFWCEAALTFLRTLAGP